MRGQCGGEDGHLAWVSGWMVVPVIGMKRLWEEKAQLEEEDPVDSEVSLRS